eukprot:2809641-Amphidinium_carterae.1
MVVQSILMHHQQHDIVKPVPPRYSNAVQDCMKRSYLRQLWESRAVAISQKNYSEKKNSNTVQRQQWQNNMTLHGMICQIWVKINSYATSKDSFPVVNSMQDFDHNYSLSSYLQASYIKEHRPFPFVFKSVSNYSPTRNDYTTSQFLSFLKLLPVAILAQATLAQDLRVLSLWAAIFGPHPASAIHYN